MKPERSKTITRVCVEVTRTNLHAVIHEQQGASCSIKTCTIPWRRESLGLTLEYGQQEFATALLQLVQQENMQDCEFHFALGGEFCISRYTSGPPRQVAERVTELESQCTRFLLLGQGQKLAASAYLQTEEGDHRALVSAFNRQALRIMLEAAGSLGIPVRSVKASPVLMAGLINKLPSNSGGLVLRIQDERIDLLVVDQGWLLLDVRPAQSLGVNEIIGFISERKALLERFFGRHSLSDRRSLDCIFVSGEAEDLWLRRELMELGFSVHALSDELAGSSFPISDEADYAACSGALAAHFGVLSDTEEIICPDLQTVLHDTETQSLKARVVQTFWPLVAAALLCMMFHCMANKETRVAANFYTAVAEYNEVDEAISSLEMRIEELEEESTHLTAIESQTWEPSWNQLVGNIAGCLSADGSLTSWVVGNDRTVQMRGQCLEEDLAYQFVEHVNHLPAIRKAALASTKNAGGGDRGYVEFDVVAEMQSFEREALAEASTSPDSVRR